MDKPNHCIKKIVMQRLGLSRFYPNFPKKQIDQNNPVFLSADVWGVVRIYIVLD